MLLLPLVLLTSRLAMREERSVRPTTFNFPPEIYSTQQVAAVGALIAARYPGVALSPAGKAGSGGSDGNSSEAAASSGSNSSSSCGSAGDSSRDEQRQQQQRRRRRHAYSSSGSFSSSGCGSEGDNSRDEAQQQQQQPPHSHGQGVVAAAALLLPSDQRGAVQLRCELQQVDTTPWPAATPAAAAATTAGPTSVRRLAPRSLCSRSPAGMQRHRGQGLHVAGQQQQLGLLPKQSSARRAAAERAACCRSSTSTSSSRSRVGAVRAARLPTAPAAAAGAGRVRWHAV